MRREFVIYLDGREGIMSWKESKANTTIQLHVNWSNPEQFLQNRSSCLRRSPLLDRCLSVRWPATLKRSYPVNDTITDIVQRHSVA